MIRISLPLVLTLVSLMIVSCGSKEDLPSGSGFIEATEVVVSAEAAGRLERLFFDEGDKIEKGDAIALIDTTTLFLRLDHARARQKAAHTQERSASLQVEKASLDSSLAGREFHRMSTLIESGSVNRQEYDRSETRYRQASLAAKTAAVTHQAARAELAVIQAEIDIIKKQLSDCRPRSPLSGTVVTAYVEEGELVNVGKSLVKIAELDPVTVKIYLPPRDLTRIKLGDKAQVDPEDGRENPIEGVVSWISPEAEFTPKNVQTKEARADLVYAVKVTIPNPEEELKVGMPVMVSIP